MAEIGVTTSKSFAPADTFQLLIFLPGMLVSLAQYLLPSPNSISPPLLFWGSSLLPPFSAWYLESFGFGFFYWFLFLLSKKYKIVSISFKMAVGGKGFMSFSSFFWVPFLESINYEYPKVISIFLS